MAAKNVDNPFSFEKAEDSTGFLLWQVTSLWQRELRKALEPLNLTHSQYVLLASIYWLNLQKMQVTQILLSGHTKIDPMTTSTVLRTLQKKNLIKRIEHPVDTRAKTVTLTAKGLTVTAEAINIVERFDAIFFEPVKTAISQFHQSLTNLMSVAPSG